MKYSESKRLALFFVALSVIPCRTLAFTWFCEAGGTDSGSGGNFGPIPTTLTLLVTVKSPSNPTGLPGEVDNVDVADVNKAVELFKNDYAGQLVTYTVGGGVTGSSGFSFDALSPATYNPLLDFSGSGNPSVMEVATVGNTISIKAVRRLPSVYIPRIARTVTFKDGRTQKEIEIPEVSPLNEYAYAGFSVLYTYPPITVHAESPGNAEWTSIYDGVIYDGNIAFVSCFRFATSLSLQLSDATIDMGALVSGDNSVITKSLTWKATGSGVAERWTMTINSAGNQVSGTDFLLGSGRVKITDAGGNVITPGVASNISGTTGSYTFTFDPIGAVSGAYENRLNFTLTAN
ncbi:hypothetical protein H8I69_06000 [Serratia fonticola]|uniref:hypothetical protein n=1 Tax=Serratia fonticola TaxID=47917 RepID=UPI0015C5F46F|nr:hypothetical protein [Serratia fonticola]MBC3378670.1 hypothetical protein [Serratia fonticola]NYA37870.1 hypothetical protein [Serratia fonticola]